MGNSSAQKRSSILTEDFSGPPQQCFPIDDAFPEGSTGAFLSQVPVLPVDIRIKDLVQRGIASLGYFPSKEEKDDPKLYANNIRKQMAIKGKLALSYHGLSDKREYLSTLNNYTMFLPKMD